MLRWENRGFGLGGAMFWATLLFAVVLVTAPGFAAQTGRLAELRKTVLVLYGERLDLPAILMVEQSLRETFAASNSPRVEWFEEYFDFARFSTPQDEASFARYLRERYAGRKIDLLMPVSNRALRFVLQRRTQLFPAVPVVYAVERASDVDTSKLPENVTGVAAKTDVRGTIELILKLQPDVREIVCVAGMSQLDHEALTHVRQALERYANRFRARVIPVRSMAQVTEEVRRLPRSDAVLLSGVRGDARGHALSVPEVAQQLVAVSKAPIYGMAGTLMGSGIVGGSLVDFVKGGRQAAQVALKILNGTPVLPGSSETKSPSTLTVDWRALRHWDLPVSRLPPEAGVKFRRPTMWEEHRTLLLAIGAVLLVQTVLIVGLLAQREWRRRSEREVQELRQELAHTGRVTMLGQMASSLAHELNQPLGAILRNAEAAEIFLQSDAPDLNELRAIVTDIRKDDQRAGGVIDRLRTLLKRRQLDSRPLSLDEVVDEVVMLTRTDSAMRHVAVELDLPDGLPLVRGDRIHLQQVLLNLLINGMDALANKTDDDRTLTVSARQDGDRFVEVAVSDNGLGIPLEKVDKLFEPFFTTKPQGMGLGLSISRSIIKTHGGRLWAENNAAGGATFRFTLPIAKSGVA